MFLAGQASVAYGPRYCPSSFRPVVLSALVAAAVTLLVVTATESGARIVDRVAHAAVPEATSGDPLGSRPTAPVQEGVHYHLEIGDSLGWVVSLLVGRKSVGNDSSRPERSLVQLREALLNEGAQPWTSGPAPDRRDENTKVNESPMGSTDDSMRQTTALQTQSK
jgi:hypothetical protein